MSRVATHNKADCLAFDAEPWSSGCGKRAAVGNREPASVGVGRFAACASLRQATRTQSVRPPPPRHHPPRRSDQQHRKRAHRTPGSGPVSSVRRDPTITVSRWARSGVGRQLWCMRSVALSRSSSTTLESSSTPSSTWPGGTTAGGTSRNWQCSWRPCAGRGSGTWGRTARCPEARESSRT
jgi:hypothetical protein